MAGPWEDYKSTQGNPWEQYGGAPTGEPSGDIVKRATEPGLGTKIYDLVLGRPKGDYAKSVSEAVSIAAPQQGGDVSGGIVDYLAPKVGANVAAAVGTADKMLRPLYNLPETAGRGAAAAMGGLLEGSYAPTAIRHGAGAAGDLVEYGTGSKVAGDIVGNAINYPAQFLAPGKMISSFQRGAQAILPRLNGAQLAMMENMSQKFGSKLGEQMIEASKREREAGAAYQALSEFDKIPMSETSRTLSKLIAKEGRAPSGASSTFENLQKVIQDNGGTLSPQLLDEQLSHVGEALGSLKATTKYNVNPRMSELFAAMTNDARTATTRSQKITSYVKNPKTETVTTPSQAVPATKATLAEIQSGQATYEAGGFVTKPATRIPGEPTTIPTESYNLVTQEIPATRAGEIVLAKRDATRQRLAYEEVTKAAQKLILSRQGYPNDFSSFRAPDILKWMKDQRNLRKLEAIPEPDLADLQTILEKMAELPVPPSPRGVNYGSGRIAQMMAKVSGPLLLAGVPTGIAVGAGEAIVGLDSIIGTLLPSRIGRKLVLKVLESGPINQLTVNMLAGAARAIAPASTIADEIKKALRTDAPLQVKQQVGMSLANPQSQ